MAYLGRGLSFSHQIDPGKEYLIEQSIKIEPEFFDPWGTPMMTPSRVDRGPPSKFFHFCGSIIYH